MVFFPVLSEKSLEIMDQWKNDHGSGPPFFSSGPPTSAIYMVDSTARFYEGKSGALLIKIVSAMNLSTDQVFICNCDNLFVFDRTIKKYQPRIIITLGSKAGKALTRCQESLTVFRGKFFEYQGIRVMPTFHPSLLVKDPQYKRHVWEDLKQVMAAAGLDHGA
jgi:uracil-DNA glycosylase